MARYRPRALKRKFTATTGVPTNQTYWNNLTPTEKAVALHIAGRKTKNEIAEILDMTPSTIEWQTHNVYSKTNTRSGKSVRAANRDRLYVFLMRIDLSPDELKIISPHDIALLGRLTEEEINIVQCLIQGWEPRDIAEEISTDDYTVTANTVEKSIKGIPAKLGLENNKEVMALSVAAMIHQNMDKRAVTRIAAPISEAPSAPET